MEIQAHIAEKQENNDPNLNIGGRFKLLENYSKDMMYEPEIMEHNQTPEGFPIQDVTQSMYLEADPKDPNVFYFSSTNALFKCDRRVSNEPVRLDTTGLGAVSCLSMSDNQYLLAGFTCGSIALYHQSYRSPVTVWYNACKFGIVYIKWCLMHYDDSKSKTAKKQATSFLESNKFQTRLCEFFAVD
jgi:hypothetical protein